MVRSTKNRSHFVAIRISNLGLAAKRCQAFRKRSNDQCGQFAMSGKNVCALHGGHSKGAKTPEGKERQRRSITSIGTEGRKQREERLRKMRELDRLEMQINLLGLLS